MTTDPHPAVDPCPRCNTNLRGEPIPDRWKEQFAPDTHWQRKIGIFGNGTGEIIRWKCPYCDHEWGRE